MSLYHILHSLGTSRKVDADKCNASAAFARFYVIFFISHLLLLLLNNSNNELHVIKTETLSTSCSSVQHQFSLRHPRRIKRQEGNLPSTYPKFYEVKILYSSGEDGEKSRQRTHSLPAANTGIGWKLCPSCSSSGAIFCCQGLPGVWGWLVRVTCTW